MKNRTLFSMLLASLLCIHTITHSYQMSAKMYAMASNFRVKITPQQALIGSCVVAGTFFALWLAKKTHSTYKAYVIKKQEEKRQYEICLNNCLPIIQKPSDEAPSAPPANIDIFNGIEPIHIERLFDTICFNTQQNVKKISNTASFEEECQKAYARIAIFKNHTFLSNVDQGIRMQELHTILCAHYIDAIKTFALQRIIEKTGFFRISPFHTHTTTTPGMDDQFDTSYDAIFFNNKYIAAVECLGSIAEHCDSLPLYLGKTPCTDQASIEAVLQKFSANIFQKKNAYREGLLTLQNSLKQHPLYRDEIEFRRKEHELAAHVEAERQRIQAIDKQTYAIAQQTESARKYAAALRQHAIAQEEHNRLEREKLHHTPQQEQRHFAPRF